MDSMAEEQNRTLNDKFMLRLPDGMRDRIKAAAEANNRSMNAEIVARLEDSFASRQVAASEILDRIDELYAEITEIRRTAQPLTPATKSNLILHPTPRRSGG